MLSLYQHSKLNDLISKLASDNHSRFPKAYLEMCLDLLDGGAGVGVGQRNLLRRRRGQDRLGVPQVEVDVDQLIQVNLRQNYRIQFNSIQSLLLVKSRLIHAVLQN